MPPVDNEENEKDSEEKKEVPENSNGVVNQFRSFFITEEQRQALDEAILSDYSRPGVPGMRPRRSINEDIVKVIRNQDLSPEAIATIQIPVPKALECDPHFRPTPEVQIVQMMIEKSTTGDVNIGECMKYLCKTLAEKRIFGLRLMSLTTVGGLNHSNYSNLPIKGICYMQNVCWRVLRKKCTDDEDFWDKFRVSIQTVVARCRKIRQARRNRFEELRRNSRFPPSDSLFDDYGGPLARPPGSNASLLEQLIGQNLLNNAPANGELERIAGEARRQRNAEDEDEEEED